MNSIISYVLIGLLVVIDIYFYIDNLFFSPDSNYQEKIRKSKMVEKDGITYDLYKRNAAISVNSLEDIVIEDEINGIPIYEIDFDKEIVCKSFTIGKNVNYIHNLKLKCEKIINNSDSFKVENDLLLDKFSNVVLILKDKTKEEIFEIAKKYSIRRDALSYFTNAKYYQFVYYKKMFDLRLSKPYYDKDETLWAIIPEKVNEKVIESVSINFGLVDYMTLGKNVKRVIIEKKSEFNDLKIDKENPYLTIYKDSLLVKETQKYLMCGTYSFNKVGTENKKNIESDYKKLNKKYLNFSNKITYKTSCK